MLLGQQMVPAVIFSRKTDLTLAPIRFPWTDERDVRGGKIGMVVVFMLQMITKHFFERSIAGFVAMIVQTSDLIKISKSAI